MLRKRPSPPQSGFIEPCRPSKTAKPPSGPLWVHEVKHDGFRLMVRREGSRVRCFTRGGYDWSNRFTAIVEAATRMKAQSFLIDGEAVVCRDDGLSDFDALRSGLFDADAMLFAFDLIEHQGVDLRKTPLLDRKRQLVKLIGKAKHAIQFNEHIDQAGPTVFEHACRLGFEGIVSKRIDAPYRSGPSKTWLKSKNPLSGAVQREREEDWN